MLTCVLLAGDRQPYIYRINETDVATTPLPDGTPRLSITPITHRLRSNLIFSYNFHGVCSAPLWHCFVVFCRHSQCLSLPPSA
jgi:hypothetical protein